jgi:3-hydroxyisobutyrate dehydrogenase-like beta-hydroxyacid dehydrogenase
MRIGFIGLGNIGAQLAGNLLRHGSNVTVLDLDPLRVQHLVSSGAKSAANPHDLTSVVDLVITCLPSPAACQEVMEGANGVLAGLTPGKIWLEMSTTDQAEVTRLAFIVEARGGFAMDCPVSGGCHRASSDRKHRHLRWGRAHYLRKGATRAGHHGSANSAYGTTRVCLCTQGADQLSLHGASNGTV